MIISLGEEAEAISWYDQRMPRDRQPGQGDHGERAAGGVQALRDGPGFLLRRTPKWKAAMEQVLFTEGDIVELGEEAEEAADEAPED